MARTNYFARGRLGFLESAAGQAKLKILFALVNEKKTHLGWYLLTETLGASQEKTFESSKSADDDDLFGMSDYDLGTLTYFSFAFDVRSLLGSVAGTSTGATFDFQWSDEKPNHFIFSINLAVPRQGHQIINVYLGNADSKSIPSPRMKSPARVYFVGADSVERLGHGFPSDKVREKFNIWSPKN